MKTPLNVMLVTRSPDVMAMVTETLAVDRYTVDVYPTVDWEALENHDYNAVIADFFQARENTLGLADAIRAYSGCEVDTFALNFAPDGRPVSFVGVAARKTWFASVADIRPPMDP